MAPKETAGFKELERAMFAILAPGRLTPAPLFILGSPRTGSTLIYQLCVERFALPFIANLTNDRFAETPIVGLAIQKSVPVTIGHESRFGKTDGAFQPSEGSAVMRHWFGGDHPSQVKSTRILDGMEDHLLRTLAAAEALYGKPLAIKNAWNCFRIEYLASALPKARFLWIRRDICAAALSDLKARCLVQGSANAWNSATPANYEALKHRPPAEQAVENQYEFNRAVGENLAAHAKGRWTDIWYEDLIVSPESAMQQIGAALGLAPLGAPVQLRPFSDSTGVAEAERAAVHSHLVAHLPRLGPFRHPGLA